MVPQAASNITCHADDQIFANPAFRTLRRARARLVIAFVLAFDGGSRQRRSGSSGLDRGFRRLYDLDFPRRAEGISNPGKRRTPRIPWGRPREAAGVLFSEFNRLGVLEAQFYEDDSVFAARKKYEADPEQRARFEQQLEPRGRPGEGESEPAIRRTGTRCWR